MENLTQIVTSIMDWWVDWRS